MNKSKSILEIGIYLNARVKELVFDDLLHFLNDKEVSEILYDTIVFGGLFVPSNINTSKFTLETLSQIADSNFQLDYCKEKLAKELNVHEQTVNKWLLVFDEDLYFKLYNLRKLSFNNLYQIIVALGFDESKKVVNRKELAERCNLNSTKLRDSLSCELLIGYKKFLKYPPVFSNQVLNFFEVEEI